MSDKNIRIRLLEDQMEWALKWFTIDIEQLEARCHELEMHLKRVKLEDEQCCMITPGEPGIGTKVSDKITDQIKTAKKKQLSTALLNVLELHSRNTEGYCYECETQYPCRTIESLMFGLG